MKKFKAEPRPFLLLGRKKEGETEAERKRHGVIEVGSPDSPGVVKKVTIQSTNTPPVRRRPELPAKPKVLSHSEITPRREVRPVAMNGSNPVPKPREGMNHSNTKVKTTEVSRRVDGHNETEFCVFLSTEQGTQKTLNGSVIHENEINSNTSYEKTHVTENINSEVRRTPPPPTKPKPKERKKQRHSNRQINLGQSVEIKILDRSKSPRPTEIMTSNSHVALTRDHVTAVAASPEEKEIAGLSLSKAFDYTGESARPFAFLRAENEAKSDKEVVSDKSWLEAEKVWVIHKGGFSGGKVIKSITSEDDENALCKVKLDQGGEVIDVEEESIEKANPPQYDRAEDLAALRYLNESSSLHTLRQRYGSNLIHSYAGRHLMVINPMQQLGIYADKVIQMFKGCKQEDMPPHVYAAAQTSYRNMLASRMDQSLVMLGTSGSGKTTNAKHILTYLATATASQHSTISDQNIEATFELLEAFGNCSSLLNQNASKFTLLYSLDFDTAGFITSGTIQSFLLEKSRVIRQPHGESSFHIFYYLLAGCDPKLSKDLQLDSAMNEPNHFIKFDPKSPENQQYADKWMTLEFALQVLGISQEESKGIWSTLAAIYHLGAAGVAVAPGSNKPVFQNPAAAQRAAEVLGTTREELSRIIFTQPSVSAINIRIAVRRRSSLRSMSSTENTPPQTPSIPEETTSSLSNAVTFQEGLEGFAMGLYMETFHTLIRLINRSIENNTRCVTAMHVLDFPGFQNPAKVGRTTGATFEEFCHNYENERIQKFFHDNNFTSQLDRYAQENIDCSFESVSVSPEPVIAMIDKAAQGMTRGSSLDLKNEQKGLLWILDEESIFPGASESSFLARIYIHHSAGKEALVKQGTQSDTFFINHCQNTLPVLYNSSGWLKQARENPAAKQAHNILSDSTKSFLSKLHQGHSSGVELSRTRSMRRLQYTPAPAIKKNSQCLQLIYQVDGLLEAIRKTQINFVTCIAPISECGQYDSSDPVSAAKAKEMAILDVPFVRQQLRATQTLDSVRIHRQGYPEHMSFAEFRRRFDILVTTSQRSTGPVLDEKKAVGQLLENIELDKRSYRLGLSQVFFRAGTLAQLEDSRDDKTTDSIVEFQAFCRGYLSRKRYENRKIQYRAITCIQRNMRKFLKVQSWPWWRLYTKVLPLLDVHRTEEELKSKSDELESLKSKLGKTEKERDELLESSKKLEQKVQELTITLADERQQVSNSTELLEQETMARMRLSRDLEELQDSHDILKKKKEHLEVELLEAKTLSHRPMVYERVDGEGASEDDEEESFYRDKYMQVSREHEQLRKKLQSQAEQELLDMENQKRAVERKLVEEKEENDELRRTINNLKRKSTKVVAETEDLKLMLENAQTRNSDLEKKQRKFDAEFNRMKEQVDHEKSLRDKITREKEVYMSEKLRLERDLEEKLEELELSKKELSKMEVDYSEISKIGNQGDSEVMLLKRQKRELDNKVQEQEEELDEQAGQIQMLEQAKLRLEMEVQKLKHDMAKEQESKEEEMEEMKYSLQKKVKSLEEQLETEYSEKAQAVKAKRETDRKLMDLRETMDSMDPELEKRLKKELRRTKALLRDAQSVIDNMSLKAPKEKTLLKQLRNEVEDAQYQIQAAIKSKKQLEQDLQDLQTNLDFVSKARQESDEKVMSLSRENVELSSRVEEDEEEMENLITKNKSLVIQNTQNHEKIMDLSHQVQSLTDEKEHLETVNQQLESRVSYLETATVDRSVSDRSETKVKTMEHQLDIETATRRRLEVQIVRLKESVQKLLEEKDRLLSSNTKLTTENSRLDRQHKEGKEDHESLEKQAEDNKKRRIEAENEVENLECQVTLLKQDLALANKRIDGLQQSLEDDQDYDLDDLGSDDSDIDIDIDSPRSRRSEPTSFRSFDDVDEGDNISDRLRRKLNSLEDDVRSRRQGTLDKDDLFENNDRSTSRQKLSGDSFSKRKSSDLDTTTTRSRRKFSEESDGKRQSRRRSDLSDEGSATRNRRYDDDVFNLKST